MVDHPGWRYGLAPGVTVDARAVAVAALDRAARLAAEGRHQAVLAAAGPAAELSGDALLPGEDDAWLAGPHRREARRRRAAGPSS